MTIIIEGKEYIKVLDANQRSLRASCGECAFVPNHERCLAAPDCITDGALYHFEEAPEDDFLSGSKACDLSGEGPCEGCQ